MNKKDETAKAEMPAASEAKAGETAAEMEREATGTGKNPPRRQKRRARRNVKRSCTVARQCAV